MWAICSIKSLQSLPATLRLSPIAFCHGMLFVKHCAHRGDCGSFAVNFENNRHESCSKYSSRRFPFFQPDMFIAGAHQHRQGTYQTENEPTKKYFNFGSTPPFLSSSLPEFHPADDAVASRRGSMTSVKREGGAKNGGKRTGERKRGREGWRARFKTRTKASLSGVAAAALQRGG